MRRLQARITAMPRVPRALAGVVRRLHDAAVRVLRDDVRHLERGRAEAVDGRARAAGRLRRFAHGRVAGSGQGLLPENGAHRDPDGAERSSADVAGDGLAANWPRSSTSRTARADRRSPRRHAVDSRSRHVRHRPRRAVGDGAGAGRPRRRTRSAAFSQRGPRRRAHRRCADSQPAVCVELGSVGRARQPRRRVPDRARPRVPSGCRRPATANFIRACRTRRPKRAPATGASIWSS